MQKMHYNIQYLCNMHIKAADIPMRFSECVDFENLLR